MPPDPAAPTRSLVIVVDDDPDVCHLVRRWLEFAGLEVKVAQSGAEMLRLLGTCLPDLVLVDLDLGDMSGMQILPRIQELDREAAAVMLTASSKVEHVVQAVRAGALDYLVKPIERRLLLETVGRALATVASARTSRQRQIGQEGDWHGLVGRSEAMQRVRAQIDRVAGSEVTVLIGGETGTGKELVARAIHAASARAGKPFVPVNCGAIAKGLQESELFGHERGAFTGAAGRRTGRFEQADGGVIFLDEVAELDPSQQVALLRVLQERTFFRVGGTEEVTVDVRVIAATHNDLLRDVREGRFREDLFYRLAVYELEVPPLRAREGDVTLLARRFLQEAAERGGRPPLELAPATLACLEAYPWPGNVRELRNAMERASVAANQVIEVEHLPGRIQPGAHGDLLRRPAPPAAPPPAPGPAAAPARFVDEASEREEIVRALKDAQGNVSQAMRRLGIPRTTMYRKLRRYGILESGEDQD
ncbi:sigma-54 dependent transcriptional regulator [Myxococcota bacterium]|nr:sigma-54 dependent transcriptional regulator [Myxococcota bacterium]